LLGPLLGDAEGSNEGPTLGKLVGAAEGSELGKDEGRVLGLTLGDAVGKNVGAAVSEQIATRLSSLTPMSDPNAIVNTPDGYHSDSTTILTVFSVGLALVTVTLMLVLPIFPSRCDSATSGLNVPKSK